jgi:farnesyl-diphosphate farnesyltransferase
VPIPSTAPPHSDAELQKRVLRSVSRSFYLSIRVLPRKVRDPIALGYLLARATDTIADTAEIDASARLQHLSALADIIQANGEAEATDAIRSSFAALQTNASERALIEALPQCIQWLRAIEEADRRDIQRVLAHINKGQALDVQRFGDTRNVVALQTAAELDQYTYLVAGCVGEFWTNVCFRKLRDFAAQPHDEMVSLGVRYGKALQLINILRDLGSDLRAGRCYLPAEQLEAVGVAAHEIAAKPSAIAPVLHTWHDSAAEGLRAGIDYACAIRSPRVRLATALPSLIGARTLALLRAAGPNVVSTRVKVSRSEVQRILLRTAATFASPAALRRQFDSYRK